MLYSFKIFRNACKRLKTALFLCAGMFASAGTLQSCGGAGRPKQELPNIVVILADDMGYGDAEVYNPDSKVPTPNINALAAAGMRFTDAHSPSSVCTPTRYGLLTGRYAWRTELRQSVLWAWDRPLIKESRETMPKMLKKRGYATACIGKWHLGWLWPGKQGGFVNDSLPIADLTFQGRNDLWKEIDFSQRLGGGPLAAGFDYYFGDDVPNFPPYVFIENDRLTKIPDGIKPDSMFGTPGPMVRGWDLREVMPAITDKAVSYIREQAKQDGPFFLYFPLTAPHTPIAPSPEFRGKSNAGLYGDYVHQVDHTVGQIVEALRQSGEWENTLLVFTSDNGSPQRDGTNMAGSTGSVLKYGHNPSGHLRGIKAGIWEGGHRMPFIVSWPGRIKEGQLNRRLIGINDLMATFAAVTGVPGAANRYEDSRDFSAWLAGDSARVVREDLIHHSIKGMFAIRKGPWKLIAGQGSGGWQKGLVGKDFPEGQLYNLSQDPGETKNLYNEHPEIVRELSALLRQYQDQGYTNPDFNRK